MHSIFMAWIAKLPIAMRKSHCLIRKDKLHEMLLHGWFMPFGSTQSWTNFAIEVSNSRSRNGIYQFGYKLTAFGFWPGEPGFDILRINRGPQSRSRDLQIAIEALKLSSRSSNSSSRCWSRSLWHVSFVSLPSAAPRFVSALSHSSSQVCVCPFCVSRRENGLGFFSSFHC